MNIPIQLAPVVSKGVSIVVWCHLQSLPVVLYARNQLWSMLPLPSQHWLLVHDTYWRPLSFYKLRMQLNPAEVPCAGWGDMIQWWTYWRPLLLSCFAMLFTPWWRQRKGLLPDDHLDRLIGHFCQSFVWNPEIDKRTCARGRIYYKHTFSFEHLLVCQLRVSNWQKRTMCGGCGKTQRVWLSDQVVNCGLQLTKTVHTDMHTSLSFYQLTTTICL